MQEIAAGRAFFRAMGYGDVKVGDTVTLDYRAGMQSEYKPEEFVVSGILYDRDEYTIEACVALVVGLPLGYVLFAYAKHNGIFGMNIYHVPIVPIFIMIFLVGLLQIVLSLVLSSNLKKETLVERIRYQG